MKRALASRSRPAWANHAASPGLDAGRLLEDARRLHRWVSTRTDDAAVEIYHRAALAMRVTRELGSRALAIQVGCEDGTALRCWNRRTGRVGFAATSGLDEGRVDWLLSNASSGMGGEPAGLPWRVDGGVVIDRDPGVGPTVEDLERWLLEATEPFPDHAAWVEAAATVESWAGSDGGAASRSRCRGWAMLDANGRPSFVAARRWSELPADRWNALLDERRFPVPRNRWAFSAESSADLVAACCAYLQQTGGGLGLRVGPGWRVRDEPGDGAAIRGGTFDDAGFASRGQILADGAEIVGITGHAGRWTRGSYRDAPSPQPSHLVVDPCEAEPTEGGCVRHVRIHPTGRSWLLETDEGSFLETHPIRLMQTCIGTWGSPWPSHRGVVTPALVFERPEL